MERLFLGDKNILGWKNKRLGPGLALKQHVVKGRGFAPKVNAFKYVLKFIAEAR